MNCLWGLKIARIRWNCLCYVKKSAVAGPFLSIQKVCFKYILNDVNFLSTCNSSVGEIWKKKWKVKVSNPGRISSKKLLFSFNWICSTQLKLYLNSKFYVDGYNTHFKDTYSALIIRLPQSSHEFCIKSWVWLLWIICYHLSILCKQHRINSSSLSPMITFFLGCSSHRKKKQRNNRSSITFWLKHKMEVSILSLFILWYVDREFRGETRTQIIPR